MKCHPLRWVWGLIPIAILSWAAASEMRWRVENDLTKRTLEALGEASQGWAKVSFDGRDGTLSGQANDESEPGKAIQVATNVTGVRVLEGQTGLLRKVDPFTWGATHRDNKVALTGFVPTEAARKQVLAAAKSAFPKADIEDKMELARGSPAVSEWMEGVRFGLKQLAVLRAGRAALSGLGLSLEGEAQTAAAYKEVVGALNTGMPKVLKLGGEKITAPSVSPYTWLAKLAGNQLVLTGYVPSEKAREDLLARARKAFGKTPVIDRMEPASGAPQDYERATRVSLDQLATLQEGAAELKGLDVMLSGVAADEAVADATRKAFKAEVPKSIKSAEAIKAAKPVVSPYVTKIDATTAAIDVTGYVPTETERVALVTAVKTRFAGRTVNDKLQLAGGEPAGHETCMMAAIGGLGRLGGGLVALSDKRVDLIGQTEDEALAIALPGEVRTAARGACETKVVINYDDSKKRKAAEEAAAKAKRDVETDAEKAKREAELAAQARRDADLAAQAKRDAEQAAAEAKRLAAIAAADQAKSAAASACESELRSAASSGTIQFERASDVLLRQSLPTVRALTDIAKKCSNVLIEIEGHTDSEGVPERNQPLSERRAQSVVDFLVENGVDASRIKAVGYGDTRPIASNDTAENRAKNRRIAFTVKNQ